MGKVRINDLFIYRWRYWIGYSAVAVAFMGLLLFAGLYIPGALSQSEVTSTIKSASIDLNDPSTLATTSLPYALLQQASFATLGVTSFSIKLPSLIVAFITGIGLILLLRRWFRPNIAVLATIIMVTTGQFLFIAQHGTAGVTHLLWATWLLLSATMFTSDVQRKTLWRVLFFILAGLSLYTPLSVYLLLAILSAAVLHPHIRHVLKKEPRAQLIGLSILSVVIASPLAYFATINPQLILDLLGAPNSWPPDIIANAVTIFQQYFNFMAPSSGAFMAPILGLGTILLIALGIYRLYTTRYTARSYTITAWGLLLVPVLLINPAYVSITFILFLLLLASGLDFLLRSWYQLFPKNPYARIAGLIPLVILVTGLVFTGVARYVYGYHYDPHTASSFSRDLTVLNHQVRPLEDNITLVTSAKEKPFYDTVAQYCDCMNVQTREPRTNSFVTTRAAQANVRNQNVHRIVTTSQTTDSDRFYIYK